jgi:hypothetical protein
LKTRGVLHVMALGLALVCAPVRSDAQTLASSAGSVAPAGPLGMSSSIGWQSEYDDNIFRTTDRPVSDIVSTFGGKTGVRTQSQRIGITANGFADWVHYSKVGSERGANAGADLRVALLGNRVAPYVTGSYINSRQRMNQEIDTRPRVQQSLAGAGAVFQIGGKTALDLAVRRSALVYAESTEAEGVRLGAALNRVSESAMISLNQQATPLTRIVLAAELSRDRFDTSHYRDVDNLRASAGFESEGRLTGRAQAGIRVLKPVHLNLPESRGYFVSAATGLTLVDRLQIGVTADFDVAPSYRSVAAYYKYSNYGGSLTYAVHRSLRLSVMAARRLADYTYGLSATSPNFLGVETQTEYGSGVSYLVGDSLSIDFSGRYASRTSPTASRLFDGSIIRAGVSHGF